MIVKVNDYGNAKQRLHLSLVVASTDHWGYHQDILHHVSSLCGGCSMR